jgi:hypothetical protein
MLNFAQAVRSVRKDYSPGSDKGRGGNPSLSGSVLSVVDAVDIMRRLLADKLKLDPSTDRIQYVNGLARSSQWSAAVGAEAARQVLEQALRAGGGKAPGFTGPYPGNIDKRSALEQLNEKAEQLRKADPTLSEAAAFVKIYESDRDLRARHVSERLAKLLKQAAA